jgi:hypothetical protein
LTTSVTGLDPSVITDVLTVLVATAGVVIGLYTFHRNSQESQELKRKEVLADIVLPLFDQFNTSEKMKIAKQILDLKPVILDENQDKYRSQEITYDQLHIALRVGSISPFAEKETEVRDSFQAFLEFLCKLDYLLAQKIMKTEDTGLFRYYIDMADKNPAIANAVQKYNYPMYGNLHKELDCRVQNNL